MEGGFETLISHLFILSVFIFQTYIRKRMVPATWTNWELEGQRPHPPGAEGVGRLANVMHFSVSVSFVIPGFQSSALITSVFELKFSKHFLCFYM